MKNVTRNDMAKFKEQLIGKESSIAANLATENGYEYRVTLEDDQYLIKTNDFKPNRINVEIKNGIVINFLNMG